MKIDTISGKTDLSVTTFVELIQWKFQRNYCSWSEGYQTSPEGYREKCFCTAERTETWNITAITGSADYFSCGLVSSEGEVKDLGIESKGLERMTIFFSLISEWHRKHC